MYRFMSETGTSSYRVRPSVLVSTINARWAQSRGLQAETIRFIYDCDKVGDDATFASLGVEDGDCIEGQVEQTGGGGC